MDKRLVDDKFNKENLVNQIADFDYFICPICKQDMIHMGIGNEDKTVSAWCNTGCDYHGDIYYTPYRKYPKKMIEYLLSVL